VPASYGIDLFKPYESRQSNILQKGFIQARMYQSSDKKNPKSSWQIADDESRAFEPAAMRGLAGDARSLKLTA